jgi:hypothetical protein
MWRKTGGLKFRRRRSENLRTDGRWGEPMVSIEVTVKG